MNPRYDMTCYDMSWNSRCGLIWNGLERGEYEIWIALVCSVVL